MALTIRNATCEYAAGSAMSSRALEDVSLEVGMGDLVVVLGPTGSGKTTLLRAAAGLLPLAGGRIEADGSVISDAASARGLVGLLFQRPEAQFFALTIEEDCAFGPHNLGRSAEEARTDAAEALGAVGLDAEAFGPREPWSLSGGEARRVALAGILAMRPRYLLLDEPTAGLDAAGCAAVCAAVDVARATAGVLIVTHDPERFIGRATGVLVLGGGRPVFSGTVPEFLDALPVLVASGTAEAPDVARTLMLAAERAGAPIGPLTLDAGIAAAELAAARSPRAGERA